MQAVDDVDLDLYAGEIHALVGENGAGKSTLAAIAFGAVVPDEGLVDAKYAVGLVHQHFQLVDRLNVWENVLLGCEPRRGWRIDRDAARARVRALAAEHGLDVDPDAIVENLPIGVQQRVELLRELERRPGVLLLDEPTAALAPTEIASFFQTITALAKAGTAVLIVTHKLQEVIDFSSRVTVMRAGSVVARYETRATSAGEIARAMVGGELPALAERTATKVRAASPRRGRLPPAPAAERWPMEPSRSEPVKSSVWPALRATGSSALADAIAGVIAYTGTIELDGTSLAPVLLTGGTARGRRARHPAGSPQRSAGPGLVDRRERRARAASDAAVATRLDRRSRRRRHRQANEVIERFDVRPPNPHAIVDALSGGNQQKIVVGRALGARPKLIVAYQPTRGIDVGAATLVRSRLIEARNAGVAVLLISFELDEIFELADRVLVMSGGRFVGAFDRAGIDRGRIGALMAGGH